MSARASKTQPNRRARAASAYSCTSSVEEFDSEFDEFVGPCAWRIEFRNLKGLIEFKQ